MLVHTFTPVLGRGRQLAHWGLLVSQCSLLGEPQVLPKSKVDGFCEMTPKVDL